MNKASDKLQRVVEMIKDSMALLQTSICSRLLFNRPKSRTFDIVNCYSMVVKIDVFEFYMQSNIGKKTTQSFKRAPEMHKNQQYL